MSSLVSRVQRGNMKLLHILHSSGAFWSMFAWTPFFSLENDFPGLASSPIGIPG